MHRALLAAGYTNIITRSRADAKQLIVWGTSTPRREFLHADDLASAALFPMNL
ncbi:NAD-dependent epimerase/dehydratase family protein [Granulicella sp. 5B5]|nr:NAD-dependent epimerase/dehydratase family protein [Granulicella sp. 5B5]